jgi:hypothetical protein
MLQLLESLNFFAIYFGCGPVSATERGCAEGQPQQFRRPGRLDFDILENVKLLRLALLPLHSRAP